MSVVPSSSTSVQANLLCTATRTPPPRSNVDPVSQRSFRNTVKLWSKYSDEKWSLFSHVSVRAMISKSQDDELHRNCFDLVRSPRRFWMYRSIFDTIFAAVALVWCSWLREELFDDSMEWFDSIECKFCVEFVDLKNLFIVDCMRRCFAFAGVEFSKWRGAASFFSREHKAKFDEFPIRPLLTPPFRCSSWTLTDLLSVGSLDELRFDWLI